MSFKSILITPLSQIKLEIFMPVTLFLITLKLRLPCAGSSGYLNLGTLVPSLVMSFLEGETDI